MHFEMAEALGTVHKREKNCFDGNGGQSGPKLDFELMTAPVAEIMYGLLYFVTKFDF
jgi:hypothetical protein